MRSWHGWAALLLLACGSSLFADQVVLNFSFTH
jgi:hypothetical protein